MWQIFIRHSCFVIEYLVQCTQTELPSNSLDTPFKILIFSSIATSCILHANSPSSFFSIPTFLLKNNSMAFSVIFYDQQLLLLNSKSWSQRGADVNEQPFFKIFEAHNSIFTYSTLLSFSQCTIFTELKCTCEIESHSPIG